MKVARLSTVLLILALAAAACAEPADTGTSSPPSTAASPSPTVLAPSVSTTVSEGEDGEENGEPEPGVYEEFDRADFDATSIDIDNPYLPLQPGTMLVYDGSIAGDEEGERIPHQIVSVVTDLVKQIDGVWSVVVWERDITDGELVEAEIAFFAQDRAGNVWRMGEYPEEYENGVLLEAPAWLSGLEDAVAGIAMPAVPLIGTPSYSQGWGPEVDFIDRGRVDAVDLDDCVFTGCYTSVVRIEEFNVDEPGAVQLKYFAPEIGNIRVDWAGIDETMEILELIEIGLLSDAELAEARAEALAMETKAYATSQALYGKTLPAERREEPAG